MQNYSVCNKCKNSSWGSIHTWNIDYNNLGNIIAAKHGPSGWRGISHDEVNLITSGINHGCHDVIGYETTVLENLILHTSSDTWAPSGSELYYENKFHSKEETTYIRKNSKDTINVIYRFGFNDGLN